jgi:hypothetical protein
MSNGTVSFEVAPQRRWISAATLRAQLRPTVVRGPANRDLRREIDQVFLRSNYQANRLDQSSANQRPKWGGKI